MAKHYVSNKKETPRLFDNEFMEKLSHIHPSVVLIIYIPVVAYFLYRSFVRGELGAGSIVGVFFLGLLFWTFFEYMAHRYVFHFHAKGNIGKKFMFIIHGVHHDYPRDPKRLVMPPPVSIPLAVVTYAIFSLVLGPVYTSPFFAGFVFGYICYDMIHYGSHHFSMKIIPGGLWLQKHHSRHHYQDENYGFGVSSPLWDFIFGTLEPKTKKEVTESS